MSVKVLTKENFETETSEGKVLVDCYADWCGPCQILSPIIDELSEDITECKFAKLNIDDEPEIAEQYEVMSIPTLLFFEDGELKQTLVGLKSKNELRKIIIGEE